MPKSLSPFLSRAFLNHLSWSNKSYCLSLSGSPRVHPPGQIQQHGFAGSGSAGLSCARGAGGMESCHGAAPHTGCRRLQEGTMGKGEVEVGIRMGVRRR